MTGQLFETPAEPSTPVENDMAGWGRTSRRGKWHQVVHSGGAPGTFYLACTGEPVRDHGQVMDYRWRPPTGDWCGHARCRREVGS